jgi:ribosomal protein L40E
MSDLVIKATVCPRCHAVLDITDNYCRHCGAASVNLAAQPDGGRAAAAVVARAALAPFAQQPSWSESPWVVLPLLFLILGPFALPLLWRSRRFTLLWKGVLTVITVCVTVFLIWSVWFSVNQALAPLRELEKLQGI